MAGEKVVSPETSSAEQVRATEGEGQEPLDDLPGGPTGGGPGDGGVTEVATVGHADDPHQLDDLRRGNQGAAGKEQAKPPAYLPVDAVADGHARQRQGERQKGHERLAAEQEQGPKDSHGGSDAAPPAPLRETQAGGRPCRGEDDAGDLVVENQGRQGVSAPFVARPGRPPRPPPQAPSAAPPAHCK